MKRTLSIILCIVTLISIFSLGACSDNATKELESVASGTKLELNETTLKITKSFEVAEAKNGFIDNVKINVAVSGYPDLLSYFNGVVTVVWNYEYLNDSGEYIPATYKATVNISSEGNGSFSETVKFTKVRNIRNVTCEIKSEGFAVKK